MVCLVILLRSGLSAAHDKVRLLHCELHQFGAGHRFRPLVCFVVWLSQTIFAGLERQEDLRLRTLEQTLVLVL